MRHAILAFCFASCLFPSIAFAQSQATTGTIQGYVKDESGGVLPGAEVTVRHVETGQTRELVTDSTGYYRALSLPSGTYEITAGQAGFTKLRQTGIGLTLGQSLDVSLVLKVAAASEMVTVEATSPLLETSKTEVSSIISKPRSPRSRYPRM